MASVQVREDRQGRGVVRELWVQGGLHTFDRCDRQVRVIQRESEFHNVWHDDGQTCAK